MSSRSLPYSKYDSRNYVKITGRTRPVRSDRVEETIGPNRIKHSRRPWSEQNRKIDYIREELVPHKNPGSVNDDANHNHELPSAANCEPVPVQNNLDESEDSENNKSLLSPTPSLTSFDGDEGLTNYFTEGSYTSEPEGSASIQLDGISEEEQQNNAIQIEENRADSVQKDGYVIPDSDENNSYFDFLFLKLNNKTEVTVFDAYKMVQALTTSSKLSYTSVLDIIKMLNIVIGHKLIPESEYIYKKVCNDKNDYERHYFCNKDDCVNYFGMINASEIKTTPCPICNNLEKEYFIYKPIEESLKTILNENFSDLVFHKDEMVSADKNSITDINTGEWHRNNTKFNGGNFVSININTDGVSPFNSSKKKPLWPILAIVNDLPIKKRFRKENVLVSGYWMSSISPNFDVFFIPFINELNNLYDNGFLLKGVNYKLLVCCCCCDCPARCKVLKIKQFNGHFGCTYCMHPTINKVYQSLPDIELRTFENYREHHRKYLELPENERKKKNTSYMGVKGLTSLVKIRQFDPILQTPIDVMHCCFLGVVRSMLSLWLDSKHSLENYYIKPSKKKIINEKLSNLKFYSECTRPITSIENYHTFKASELFNWVFYCSRYCLSDYVLKPEYYKHYVNFVNCLEELFSRSITIEKLAEIDKKLCLFVREYEYYYGTTNMVYNVHLLSHICSTVRLFGPLITTSLFVYENLNGVLGTFLKGPNGPLIQLSIRHYLFFKNYYSETEKMSKVAQQFCKSTLHKNSVKYKHSNLHKKFKIFILPEHVINNFNNYRKFRSYEKFIIQNLVLTTDQYAQKNKYYNDSYIFYNDAFIQILKILKPFDNDEQADDNHHVYILGRTASTNAFKGVQNFNEIYALQGAILIKVSHDNWSLRKCLYYKTLQNRECLTKIENMLVID